MQARPFDLHISPWSDLPASDESDQCASRGDETAGIFATCSLARLLLAYVGFRGPCWLNQGCGLTSSLSQHLLGIVPAAGRQIPLVMAMCSLFVVISVWPSGERAPLTCTSVHGRVCSPLMSPTDVQVGVTKRPAFLPHAAWHGSCLHT